MAASDSDDVIAQAFDEQRGRLVAVASRMLGSRADAEDAVQEAWLKLSRQDATTIDNLAGWLTTVVGRVCIDILRSRKARREVAYDDRVPELLITDDSHGTPEDETALAESVGLALMVVLDTLSPAERLAFVLHDMFAVTFEEIGPIIGKSANASKMLASRARQKVQASPRPAEQRRHERSVVDAFLAAARDGDFEGLLRVLDPGVTWRTHTAHGVEVLVGAPAVATDAQRRARVRGQAHRVLVNGEPGIVAWSTTGIPIGVMGCTVVGDRIVEILSLRDPERLAAMNLPGHPD
ncbi:sigma-70 family RNA polymerase sigma factor [Mycetocola zhujimingii]|uniref:sigma-70 family RNA polymerase sigma factor n=1 Tax=Mycetocola zhujimingii TaxID=2079792 RepID=UPI000D36A75F|nr:sigma-70 family RNA polymerase sigma factor [Mycetocola zhujimingii]AWB86918.1 RNA polymerase subunit sigma-70 [Mycetocola zhujimingii]